MVRQKQKMAVGRLPTLPGEKELSYLVTLSYRKPKTIFYWPLYLSRSYFCRFVKLYESEIEGLLWKKQKTGWQVKLINGHKLEGLDSIDNFLTLKDQYYTDKNNKSEPK